MEEELKGTFRVEVDAGTELGRELVAIRPKDVQLVKTFINSVSGDESQHVYCYNRAHPFVIRMKYAEYVALSNSVEG